MKKCLSLLLGLVLLHYGQSVVKVPTTCSPYGVVLNGFHFHGFPNGFPDIHLRFLIDHSNPFHLPNMLHLYPMLKGQSLVAINATLPLSKEPIKTCRFDNSTTSTIELDFLKAMMAKDLFRFCFICDKLQDDKGQCTEIGICPKSSVCYSGHNLDYSRHYVTNSTINEYLHPLAISHGCCDPALHHNCRSGQYLFKGRANYTITTCTGPLCNADLRSQRGILQKIQKVDGHWSSWSHWSACSATCGHGHKMRTRTCTHPAPANGGSNCTGASANSLTCSVKPCPINGHWAAWGHWSTCSATCGSGTRHRGRLCSNPQPAYGGHPCSGGSSSSKTCTKPHCPVNGSWSSWGRWSSYSATCGYASRYRTRTCNHPAPSYGGVNCSGPVNQSSTVSLSRHCPVNGGWSSWSHWSAYGGTCGMVKRYHIRTCTHPAPLYGGHNCSGSGNYTSSRRLPPCPVHGAWGSWSSYTSCSSTCGGGTRSRSRECNHPAPAFGGHTCVGTSADTSTCSTTACPVDGQWGQWSGYSRCTATCGGGTRYKKRQCDHPSPSHHGHQCVGNSSMVSSCGTSHCPVDGGWSHWSAYTKCSVTCGNGTQTRQRTCNHPTPLYGGHVCAGSSRQTQACNAGSCAVDGGWGHWSPYSPCSKTCGGGTKSRARYCDNPAPRYGGHNCAGDKSETVSCHTQPCIVDGGWSVWAHWSGCSATCGNGTQARDRSCDHPAPRNGGQTCSGSSHRTKSCKTAECPVNGDWGPWATFSTCTVTCGSGTMSRSRGCDSPAPQHGGMGCSGNKTEMETCNTSPCKVDGQWAVWTSWTACSATCGSGTASRNRTCDNPAPANGGHDCHGSSRDSKQCDGGVCPEWSPWFFGQCSVTCGTGTTMRMRHCSSGHDEDCSGQAFETTACEMVHCPIDGQWGSWVTWSACTVSCGGGSHTRHRSCDNPAPAFNGAQCAGDASQSGTCNTLDCPHWLPYHDTGACSVTCGDGSMQLERACSTGNRQDCTGSPYDERPCSMPTCLV